MIQKTPVIALVGRPNVGKSTLFNFLTQTRNALVADIPGVTRDRQYGMAKIDDQALWIIDTGGLENPDGNTKLDEQIRVQVEQAIVEADHILWMVDTRAGLTPADQMLAQQFRPWTSKITLVANKADDEKREFNIHDFYGLKFGAPRPIAANNGRNVLSLLREILANLAKNQPEEPQDLSESMAHENDTNSLPKAPIVKVALLGRPNVGKSTLVNRLLGEERMIVLDQPGTTRDSIAVNFSRDGQEYCLVDTAGVRRRARCDEKIEKFSVIKTLQTIEHSDVVIVLLNAREGISDQDLHLLGIVMEQAGSVIIAVNKWDGMSEYDRSQVKQALDRRLTFIAYAPVFFISALHGSGIGDLFAAVKRCYACFNQEIGTAGLTATLNHAVEAHQPPLVHGRRVRLRYAHIGGRRPLCIVLHGKQVNALPGAYQRFLTNYFREHYRLYGVNLQLRFKEDHNPYV